VNQQEFDWEALVSAIRLRPAMYIGSTDARGLEEMVREVLNFCLNDCIGGTANEIRCHLDRAGSLTVSDNGRALGFSSVSDSPTEAALNHLKRVDYRDVFGRDDVALPTGRCALLAIIIALSDTCEVTTRREEECLRFRFARGELQGEPELYIEQQVAGAPRTSFEIQFHPDPLIFGEPRFAPEVIEKLISEQAALIPGIRIIWSNDLAKDSKFLHSPDGALAFVQSEVNAELAIWPEPFHAEMRLGDFRADVACQFERSPGFRCCSFANGRSTVDWGTHVSAARRGLSLGLRQFLPRGRRAQIKWDIKQLLKGCVLTVAVDVPYARYEGPTRGKLANHEIEAIIRDFVSLSLVQFLRLHPECVDAWQEWICHSVEETETS
jgi:DNA gyrase subunit B